MHAATDVKAYYLSADDIAKMLLNDIYGATVRFGGVPGRGGRLQMAGASTIGVVIDAGALLEKQIDKDSIDRLDGKRHKTLAAGSSKERPEFGAGVEDGVHATHEAGDEPPVGGGSAGILRPPEHGIVPLHENIVLAPAARQAAKSCTLCQTACAGLLSGSFARGLLAMIRAIPRRSGRGRVDPSMRITQGPIASNTVVRSDMGMKSMSLASKQQADMTSRKIKALTRLDPRLMEAIYGSLPKTARSSDAVRS